MMVFDEEFENYLATADDIEYILNDWDAQPEPMSTLVIKISEEYTQYNLDVFKHRRPKEFQTFAPHLQMVQELCKEGSWVFSDSFSPFYSTPSASHLNTTLSTFRNGLKAC